MAHTKKKQKLPELVGLAEITQMAEELRGKNTSRQLVHGWITRSAEAGDMPEPALRLLMGPIWLKSDIIEWLGKLGYTQARHL